MNSASASWLTLTSAFGDRRKRWGSSSSTSRWSEPDIRKSSMPWLRSCNWVAHQSHMAIQRGSGIMRITCKSSLERMNPIRLTKTSIKKTIPMVKRRLFILLFGSPKHFTVRPKTLSMWSSRKRTNTLPRANCKSNFKWLGRGLGNKPSNSTMVLKPPRPSRYSQSATPWFNPIWETSPSDTWTDCTLPASPIQFET